MNPPIIFPRIRFQSGTSVVFQSASLSLQSSNPPIFQSSNLPIFQSQNKMHLRHRNSQYWFGFNLKLLGQEFNWNVFTTRSIHTLSVLFCCYLFIFFLLFLLVRIVDTIQPVWTSTEHWFRYVSSLLFFFFVYLFVYSLAPLFSSSSRLYQENLNEAKPREDVVGCGRCFPFELIWRKSIQVEWKVTF